MPWWSTRSARSRLTKIGWTLPTIPTCTAYLGGAGGALVWRGVLTSEQVHDFAWRCELGQRLKCHFAFQNLLRDLDRLGPKSVLVDDLLALLNRRLPKRQSGRGQRAVRAAVAVEPAGAGGARRKPGHQDFFLQVKVEIWQRELRRMVAKSMRSRC
jgi:DEAD/DEAH box helicase domain-containing protein